MKTKKGQVTIYDNGNGKYIHQRCNRIYISIRCADALYICTGSYMEMAYRVRYQIHPLAFPRADNSQEQMIFQTTITIWVVDISSATFFIKETNYANSRSY